MKTSMALFFMTSACHVLRMRNTSTIELLPFLVLSLWRFHAAPIGFHVPSPGKGEINVSSPLCAAGCHGRLTRLEYCVLQRFLTDTISLTHTVCLLLMLRYSVRGRISMRMIQSSLALQESFDGAQVKLNDALPCSRFKDTHLALDVFTGHRAFHACLLLERSLTGKIRSI